MYLRNKNEKQCIIAEEFAECHRPIKFITEPRSSILIMTQLISFLWKKQTRNSHGLLQLGREALAYCQCASALISGNKALFVSVDLIGEKNQVILEYVTKVHWSILISYAIGYIYWTSKETLHISVLYHFIKCERTPFVHPVYIL